MASQSTGWPSHDDIKGGLGLLALLCLPSKRVGGTGASCASLYYYKTIWPILQKKRGDSWKVLFTFCAEKCQDNVLQSHFASLECWYNCTQFSSPGKLLLALPYFPHQQIYFLSCHVNTFTLTLPSQDKTAPATVSVSSIKVISILWDIADLLFSSCS